jgi:hypothetical protein
VVSPTLNHSVQALAKDLSKEPPRSPRETLAGYIVVGRVLDKCRAFLNGTLGEYNFNSYMDRLFFDFTQIDAEDFQTFVATGVDDTSVASWIQANSKVQDKLMITKWNNQLRDALLKDMPDSFQLHFEDYIEQYLPKHRPVYHIFDIFDLEEGRL